VFFKEAAPQGDAAPGAVIAIQTFGDFLGFNPHCHVLCTDGCFDGKGLFRVAPRFAPEGLKAIPVSSSGQALSTTCFGCFFPGERSPKILSAPSFYSDPDDPMDSYMS